MKVTTYLTIEPTWSRWDPERIHGGKVVKATGTKPRAGKLGAAVVCLTIEIPDHVFKPLMADAHLTVDASQVGTVKVTAHAVEDEASG